MFATLVVNDYPGFDTESRLDRDEIFRLNVAVGRPAYERLLGHSPRTTNSIMPITTTPSPTSFFPTRSMPARLGYRS